VIPRRADLEALRFRAETLRKFRDHFHREGVLEVETPVLSLGISLDCHIDVFATDFFPGGHPGSAPGSPPAGRTFYLQTSPEPHMKRLLCRGAPDIYQISKAFRNGESGRLHNPEFTMLEWYRRGFSLERLMDEVETICWLAAGSRPVVRKTFQDAFREVLGVDPLALSPAELGALPGLSGQLPPGHAFADKADTLDFLMAHVIEPAFPPGSLVFVQDYPVEQAAQAQAKGEDPRLAHRFEVFGGGMELGNGYLELLDPAEYARRFEGENLRRRNQGKPQLPPDPRLLEALEAGLPACAGVALGVDRLLMLGMGRPVVGSVLAFPWEEA
jgi:elongation factor P--(R)-beta-lysine ligase